MREDGVKVGPPLGCSSRERDVGTRQGSEAAGAAREQRGAGSPQRLEAIWGSASPALPSLRTRWGLGRDRPKIS